MTDPAEHALVVKALTDGLGGCVEWDEREARRLLGSASDLAGYTLQAIRRETVRYVRQHGGDVVEQRDEDRHRWRDLYRFYYRIILPLEGLRHGLFVEVRLIDEDPDCPVVCLVNAHPQLRSHETEARMNPMAGKCMDCRNRTVVPTRLPSYTTEMEHDGRTYSVTVTDLDVRQCTNCKAMTLGEGALDRLSDGLRQKVGLLAPAEIRARREALGLTQKALAGLLQISESTLSRWETGAQYQQRCMDRLLRGFFEVPEFRRYVGWEGTPLPLVPGPRG